MNVTINPSWKPYLETEFNQPYFEELTNFVKHEYKTHICYPKGSQIFNAFNSCSFNDLKVVIIGQDPYHGVGQANGLCFSVNDGIIFPPSLQNIFKEIQKDIGNPIPETGNLERWAKQGVLLLNATLSVRENQAGSHQNKGWETFTDAVIKCVSEHKTRVVFLLWGNFAKAKTKLIDTQKHCVLTTGHPSPLSANRGLWFDNKHFSKTNNYLIANGLQPIEW
jgi:uracil-DNA glycosylase